jgi:hypothetical protein
LTVKVDDGRISCRAFSRRISVSPEAVSKAIERGRLKECVGRDADGKPYIKDPDLAEREWNQNRSKNRDLTLVTSKPTAPVAAEPTPAPVAAPPLKAVAAAAPVTAEPTSDVTGDGEQGELDLRPPTLIDSQTQANLERARKLRLENDVTEGRLIPADRVNKEAFEAERIVRESILNLPARISGELAAESDPARVQLRLEMLLRDALNAAADVLVSEDALVAVNG